MSETASRSVAQRIIDRFPQFGPHWPIRRPDRVVPHWEPGDNATPLGIIGVDILNSEMYGVGIVIAQSEVIESGGNVGAAFALAIPQVGSVPGGTGAPAFLGNENGVFVFVVSIDPGTANPITAAAPTSVNGLAAPLDPVCWNGLAFDGSSYLYVLNQGGSVYRFAYANGALTPAGATAGSADPTFIAEGTDGLNSSEGAAGIALGADGTLAVAQNEHQNILLFNSSDGSFKAKIDFPSAGLATLAPVTPAFGPDGALYVVCLEFVAGSSRGAILRFATDGTPNGLAASPSNPILVPLGKFETAYGLSLGGTTSDPIIYVTSIAPNTSGSGFTTPIVRFDGTTGNGPVPLPSGSLPLCLAIATIYANLS